MSKKQAKDAPFERIGEERLDALIDVHFGNYLSGAGYEVCMAVRELRDLRKKVETYPYGKCRHGNFVSDNPVRRCFDCDSGAP